MMHRDSKVERERGGIQDDSSPNLEIAVPYLAATYDERMFEELYRRAQLFEVTLGGDVRIEGRVEGRIEADEEEAERRRREREGIGTENEDLGKEGVTGPVAFLRTWLSGSELISLYGNSESENLERPAAPLFFLDDALRPLPFGVMLPPLSALDKGT